MKSLQFNNEYDKISITEYPILILYNAKIEMHNIFERSNDVQFCRSLTKAHYNWFIDYSPSAQ